MRFSRLKMKSLILTVFFSVVLCVSLNEAARILFLAPIGSTSHKNAFMPVVKELGKRGHEVTHVTHTKANKPSTGVTEVVIEEAGQLLKSLIGSKNFIEEDTSGIFGIFSMLSAMKTLATRGCEIYLKFPYIQDLITGKVPKPDLIISSMFFTECAMGIVHKLQVPFIYFSSGGFMPWTMSSIRAPEDLSYCPLALGGSDDRMNFGDRIQNLVMYLLLNTLRDHYISSGIGDVMKQYLGEGIPPFQDIEKNASLIILNSHFSMDYPRPRTPNIIETGGMHINDAKPLPQDLENWFSSSGGAGVVYFSLGSAFPGSSMPERFRLIFIEAFSKIPQKVVWKWEKDDMPGLPPNIRISKWLPQQDILGHPKLKLFITHGGLLSTMETTYFGIPVIGLPIAGDQKMNMKNMELLGGGIMINWKELTADVLVASINELINNPQYQKNVAHRSAVVQDRDMHPLDKAIYWIEYVLRHNGAHHLKPGSLYLNDFQYYKIDIFLFLHAVVLIWVIFTVLLCRWFYRKTCKPKMKKE